MNINKTLTNIPLFKKLNEGLDYPSELTLKLKLRDWTKEAHYFDISTKGKRSNLKAANDWIKVFMKDQKNHYVCVVVQNKLWKNDSVRIFYKEV